MKILAHIYIITIYTIICFIVIVGCKILIGVIDTGWIIVIAFLSGCFTGEIIRYLKNRIK